MKYIYQLKIWPKFTWQHEQIAKLLGAVRNRQGRLMGRMESLGFPLRSEAVLQTLTLDVIKSSEIEGEILNFDQVRSSIARRLGMDIAGLVSSDRYVEGVVEMMLDATQNFNKPLTKDRLFGWHAAMFPIGRSGMRKIVVGAWRKDSHGPMQVVSGPSGGERVHFDLVYPPLCLICHHPIPVHNGHPILCGSCSASLPPNVPPFCPVCSRSLVEHPDQPRCAICRDHPPAFDFAWSACLYSDPLRDLIHDFKFNDRTLFRHVFIPRMIQFINDYRLDIAQFDMIIPIPLSSTRLRERTYNQAELLALGLSQAFGIPLAPPLLKRSRHTASHSTLKAKERFTNIRGAFRITPRACCMTRILDGKLINLLSRDSTCRPKFLNFATGPSNISLKNKNILLVDDLLTTGATASEAARVLKSAGAGTVGVFTLAITP